MINETHRNVSTPIVYFILQTFYQIIRTQFFADSASSTIGAVSTTSIPFQTCHNESNLFVVLDPPPKYNKASFVTLLTILFTLYHAIMRPNTSNFRVKILWVHSEFNTQVSSVGIPILVTLYNKVAEDQIV